MPSSRAVSLYPIISIILACALLFALPQIWLMQADLWNIDYLFYSNAYALFSDQFWKGDFYPRWLAEANGGLGSPVFVAYSAPPAYLIALLDLLPITDPYGIARFHIAIGLTLVALYTSYYGWLRSFQSRRFSAVATCAYAACAYLAVLIYHQAALSTLMGMVGCNIVLWGIETLRHKQKAKGIRAIALGTALLLLTHLPTAICFMPCAALYALNKTPNWRSQTVLIRTLFAQIIGVAIAAIYWYPLWKNQGSVWSEQFTNDKYDFSQNGFGFYDIVFLPYLLLMLGVLVLLWRKRRSLTENTKQQVLRLSAIVALLIFMLTPLSWPLWHYLPPVRALQFHMRLYPVLMLPLGVLFAYGWRYKHLRFTLAICALFAFCFGALGLHEGYKEAFPTRAKVLEYRQAKAVFSLNKVTATKWTPLEEYSEEMLMRAPSMPDMQIISGEAQAATATQEGTSQLYPLYVFSPTASVQLKTYYFPGIKIHDQEIGESVTAKPDAHGLTLVELPEGKHVLEVKHEIVGVREGALISALGVLLLAVCCLRSCRAGRCSG